MRFLEIILLLLGVLLPFFISSKKVRISNKLLLIFTIGILIAHVLFEGIRWQMTPIYLVNIIVIGCLLKEYSFFKGNLFRKILSGAFLFLMVGIGFLLSIVLPVFDLPTPTGTYKVGSESLHFISDEDEIITDELNDKRELMVKVWYPANVTDESKELYLDKAERIGFATKYGLPKNTFNYLDKVKTNTFKSPSIAEGKFPILIFSPGYYSNATGYYALLEEIVSHGYVVLNINHTYESVGALFPSDEIKLYDLAYDRKHNNEEMASMIWTTMEKFNNAASQEEKREAVEKTLKEYFAAEITQRWTKDINMIVEQIPAWEKSTFLSNHIDTSKIGIFGHSQGGAAAGQALLENPKITTGINIDGTQWGNMIDTFFSKPFLLLSSDWPDDHPNFNEFAYEKESTSDFYLAKIKKSGHSNFMDIPLLINLSMVNEAGEIESEKAVRISSKLVAGFFNNYLKKEKNNLLKISNQHPELEIEKRK